ncbi:MAG: type II toxin-antitoxin system VapC family toxin [Thiomargarita sp.]|nr:type II toxin-antitoxin system VapC family toxin [Thiomargarita sp.]
MIVVDTNVIVYLYLSNERSEQAERLLEKDSEWVAPLLWRSELRNVLALYIRKEILSVKEAQQVMEEAIILMDGKEYEVVSFQVLELVSKSTCSAYDCEFVALAQDLGVRLVTVDKKILREFPNIAVSLNEYVSL